MLAVSQMLTIPISFAATMSCSVQSPLQGLDVPEYATAGTYQIEADRILAKPEGTSRAEGHVRMMDDNSLLAARSLVFDHAERIGNASGPIIYHTPTLELSAVSGQFDFDRKTAQILAPVFYYREEGAIGSAREMQLASSGVSSLEDASITTCPSQKHGWLVSARHIQVDENREWVKARHVVLSFKSIPLFYSPYLSFSLNEARKTGFLLPGIAATEKSGAELQIPFYWNIAPNQDATLTLRHLQRRGEMLQANYRFLGPFQEGNIDLTYLPTDRLRPESARGQARIDQHGQYPGGWFSDVQIHYASDKDYFIDLSENLGSASQTHLERQIKVGRQLAGLSYTANIQSFQTLDQRIQPTSRPYQRLPQLTFSMSRGWTSGFDLDLDTEAVNFVRSDSVEGARLYMEPTISFLKKDSGAFIQPAASLSQTTYFLKGGGKDHVISRTLPRFSLHGGLLFERPLKSGSSTAIHTLEPEIYWLYIPYKSQDGLPVFDTTDLDFNFGQLFRNNRFSGIDRIGDTNQISLGLTSSLLRNQDGRERLKISIGQIRYLRDRKVVLPGEVPGTRQESDIILDVRSQLASDWNISGQVQWDTQQDTAGKSTFRATYRKDRQRFFTLSYRFRKTQLEQTDIALVWPIFSGFNGVGRWHYSLPENRTLNTLLGIQYESCCWSVSLFNANFLNTEEEGSTQVVFMQFELKGLSSLGSRIDRLLRQEIPSYQ
ncbi:MAG: LPS-assembly protein LptD [Gammaproteobacteria bacterium]|nr:MAG: LPS-assembly protein LptD [Gammaproteobacteria bacterium]